MGLQRLSVVKSNGKDTISFNVLNARVRYFLVKGDMMMGFNEWRESQRDSISGYTERDAFKAGAASRQARIDEIKKAVLSLRNEFNLWSDDTESFHVIEAQIEQLEELLK